MERLSTVVLTWLRVVSTIGAPPLTTTDSDLLAAVIRERSRDAFAEIVNRYLGLVYGASTRDLIDVRSLFRGVIGNALFIAFTAIVSLLGISAAVFIFQKFPDEGWALVVIVAIVLA